MGIVKTEKLNIGYNGIPVLKDINLDVQSGEIVTLVGPNGSGKTTLLKTIASMLEKIEGTIYISGKDLSTLPDKDRSKLMSVMLTEKRSYDYFTCEEVIRVGRFPYTGIVGKLNDNDENVISGVMRLTGVSELSDRDFDKISDGQRQRVLLARALVQEPKIMLLDEPTSFLDVSYKLDFMAVLKKLCKDKKIGVLMSLHELDLAAAVSDRVIAISSENIVDKIGNPKEILTEEYIGKLFNIKNGSYSIAGGFSFTDEGKDDKGNATDEENVEDDLTKKNKNISESDEDKKTHYIMIQGTMSNAGKSLVAAGLCRIFKQDGYKVAPFKSQNMALNSYVTEDGLEMGRAQVMQAEAAGIKPQVYMNPILLKPTDDKGSQVIVNGKVLKNMRAKEYFEYKTSLIPHIKEALNNLEEHYDIIVIEGAGSPAEINLKKNDIVNMGIAKMTGSQVLLVGDIDRGGVFAQLLGTIELLEEDERNLIKGLIVNKFRGDKSILDPGITMLEERGNKPVVGVLPYMDINLEDEDSLTDRFEKKDKGLIDIAVVRLPHISNFTDFDVFEQIPELSVRYVKNCRDLNDADLIIIPGSKNTIADMRWLREQGFEAVIMRLCEEKKPVFGICGGYQMLGKTIDDPDGVEGGGSIQGLSLLSHTTVLKGEKHRKQVEGTIPHIGGIFAGLSGKNYYGYEIHMGESINDGIAISQNENVYGTYVHGIFDNDEITKAIVKALAEHKNVSVSTDTLMDYKDFKEQEYERLANTMREYLNMDEIYKIMGINR